MFGTFQKVEPKHKANIITAFEDDVLLILFEVLASVEKVSEIKVSFNNKQQELLTGVDMQVALVNYLVNQEMSPLNQTYVNPMSKGETTSVTPLLIVLDSQDTQ